MILPVDTKEIGEVATFTSEKFRGMFPNASMVLVGKLFADVATLFAGKHPDYSPIDVKYHDLEHTLQATVCMVQLLENRHRAAGELPLTARGFELAMAAVLLHDAGYLKLRSDTAGTGAKYTFCHVLRSCAFAASYLPNLGVNQREIETVLGAINCTGPAKEISQLHFPHPIDRVVGCALATADYLGQMSAADYPDELAILFNEFEESDNFTQIPSAQRLFRSAEELAKKTPQFWQNFVQPKLEHECQGLYRFLAFPSPDGTNHYWSAVEANIAIIKSRLPSP